MSSKLLEVLETRLNLSATFELANIVGTHEFYTNTGTGSLTIQSNGTLSGTLPFNGSTRTLSGSATVDRGGDVSMSVTFSGLGTITLTGTIAGGKDFVEISGPVGAPDSSQQVLNGLLAINSGTYTQADLGGVWTLFGERYRGSVTITNTGAVSGNYIFTSGSSGTINNSQFTLNGAGNVTGSFVLTGPGQAAYGVALTLGTNKDVIVGTVTGNGRFDQITFYKTSTGANNARLFGDYKYADTLSNGTVGFDGNGNVRGAVATAQGQGLSSVTGTYTVASDGTVTGRITLGATPGFSEYTYNFSGGLNASGTLATFFDTIQQSSNTPVPAIVGLASAEPGPFAFFSQGALTVAGRKSSETIALAVNGANLEVARGNVTQTFTNSAITSITLDADEGDDVVTVGPGIIATTLSGGFGNDSISGGGGKDSIFGGFGNDTLRGGFGGDTIYGDAGFDYIAGGQGLDSINGGDQGDTIFGLKGNDTLRGGKGQDSIEGGEGNDELTGGLGRDTLIGDVGDDTFFARDAVADQINGGSAVTVDRAQVDGGLDLVSDVESLLA